MVINESLWFRKRSWVEINLNNLAHNLEVVRETIGSNCKIMGVVKANAYGHDDQVISAELEKLGIDWLGVSELEEGLSLRRCGATKPILNLTAIPLEYTEVAAENNITTILPSYNYAVNLDKLCKEKGIKMKAHISVDTGIGRLGLEASDDKIDCTIKEIVKIAELKNIEVDGIYTHYARSGDSSREALEYTNLQYNRFKTVLAGVKKAGIEFETVHSCNSDATLDDPKYHFDMVREGINLYDGPVEHGFKPLMSLKTKITHIKDVVEGTKISYNSIFTTKRPTRVATVSLGYADGFHRCMSGKALAIVNGEKIPVIGSICMDQMMLDITGVDGVKIGDTVTLVGQDGKSSISWADLANDAGTVNYEMVCGISRRIPRIFIRDGIDEKYLSYQRCQPQIEVK